MKIKSSCLFVCALLALTSSCSKKPVEVTGQIFVVTQGRDNIKMGGVKVLVIPDKQFVEAANEVLLRMQAEVQNEAQRETDSNHVRAQVPEISDMQDDRQSSIPELRAITANLVEELGVAGGPLNSVLSGVIYEQAMGWLVEGLHEPAHAMTDADGRFVVETKGKTWFLAVAERQVAQKTESYLWIKSVEPANDSSKFSVIISNDTNIDTDHDFHYILLAATGKTGSLQEHRSKGKIAPTDHIKTIVSNYREHANQAKAKAEREAEREAAQAKAKAAQAKAEAEAAWAKSSGKLAGEEKIIEIAPSVTMTFCWCPAGQFTMGSPKSEADRGDDEDQVEVTLSQGFWMAKTEVTQAQWQAVMGDNPSRFKGENLPVESVSWNDTREFLTKVNAIVGNSDGGQMVLPSEAQWEYACRAGETGPYSGGTIDEVAWYYGNSNSKTHSVGTKKPNAWGLHDMHGNVWEWCADWYASELVGGVDPRGANSRVFRGGSWGISAISCRVASRNYDTPGDSSYDMGFRPARSSVP